MSWWIVVGRREPPMPALINKSHLHKSTRSKCLRYFQMGDIFPNVSKMFHNMSKISMFQIGSIFPLLNSMGDQNQPLRRPNFCVFWGPHRPSLVIPMAATRIALAAAAIGAARFYSSSQLIYKCSMQKIIITILFYLMLITIKEEEKEKEEEEERW